MTLKESTKPEPIFEVMVYKNFCYIDQRQDFVDLLRLVTFNTESDMLIEKYPLVVYYQYEPGKTEELQQINNMSTEVEVSQAMIKSKVSLNLTGKTDQQMQMKCVKLWYHSQVCGH